MDETPPDKPNMLKNMPDPTETVPNLPKLKARFRPRYVLSQRRSRMHVTTSPVYARLAWQGNGGTPHFLDRHAAPLAFEGGNHARTPQALQVVCAKWGGRVWFFRSYKDSAESDCTIRNESEDPSPDPRMVDLTAKGESKSRLCSMST